MLKLLFSISRDNSEWFITKLKIIENMTENGAFHVVSEICEATLTDSSIPIVL